MLMKDLLLHTIKTTQRRGHIYYRNTAHTFSSKAPDPTHRLDGYTDMSESQRQPSTMLYPADPNPSLTSQVTHVVKKRNKTVTLCSDDRQELKELLTGLQPLVNEKPGEGMEDIGNMTVMSQKLLEDLQISSAMSCGTCGITFDDRTEQTEHFKTDWHRFNIKQRLRGASPVVERDFLQMADDISSLSGTDDSDDDRSANRGEDRDNGSASDDEILTCKVASKGALLCMRTPSGQTVSLYRTVLFHKKEQPQHIADIVNRIDLVSENSLWIIILMGSGHFAAAVFDKETMVAHKTFHRYVVRAKAGTIQSQHDKKGRHAQSAGAQIRRRNEAALAQDVTDLLQSWKLYIERCSRLFVKVSTHNYKYLFNKKEKLHLDRHDLRVRAIPFLTKRPTLNEVKRVHCVLNSITIYQGAAQSVESDCVPVIKKCSNSPRPHSKGRGKRQPEPPLIVTDSDESEAELDDKLTSCMEVIDTASALEQHQCYIPSRKQVHQTSEANRNIPETVNESALMPSESVQQVLAQRSELYTACKCGDEKLLREVVERLQQHMTADSLGRAMSITTVTSDGQTLLHLASQHDQPAIVSFLLSAGCDPCVSDRKNQVPYLSTQSKVVRNEFRVFMGLNPDKYDYVKAKIPGPLTRESAALKQAKENERRREVNKKRKERAKVKKAELAVQRKEDEEKQRFLSLSDREKRALAAEKRLISNTKDTNPLVLSRCYECAADISGLVPFEYSNNTFCSPGCLKRHRLSQKT